MKKYNELFKKYSIVPKKYKFYKNIAIIDYDDKKIVIK